MLVPVDDEITVFVADYAAVDNVFRQFIFIRIIYRVGVAGDTIRFVSVQSGFNFFAAVNTVFKFVIDGFVAEILASCRVFNGVAF